MTEAKEKEPQGCLSPFLTPLKSLFGGQADENSSPRYDAFYGYNEFESTIAQHAPGTLLRSRQVQIKSFVGLKGSSMQSWQLAYTTTGPLGAEVTVCTIIIPPNAGKRDKIIVDCPKYDSANPSSRTSWTLRKGNGDPLNAAAEQVSMVPFLDRGYVAIVPDCEGQRDAFGCGVVSGKATLDAIRATLAFDSLQLAPRNEIKVAVWWYSGGAIAAAWAATYVEGYAPDLKDVIVGFAIGGLPANLTACALHLNVTISAGLILGIIQGLANAYPALQAWLDANRTKQGKEAFAEAKTKSYHPPFLERHADFWLMDTNPILDGLPLGITQENTMLDVFRATQDDNLIPKVPIYMYAGISDNICPIDPIDALVPTWKELGANVEYVRVKFWRHVGLAFAKHSETVQWIQDRLEGKELKNPSGSGGNISEATRNIADKDSSAALENNRAEQLREFFETAFEKTGRLWF